MKSFTKLMFAAALLVASAASTSAQTRAQADFSAASNTNATWTSASDASSLGSFKWNAGYYNQIRNIGLPNGDISDYKTVGVEFSFNDGDRFRVLFYSGSSNFAVYINADGAYRDGGFTDKVASTSATGNGYLVEIPIYETIYNPDKTDWSDYILKCTEVCLSGLNDNGEVVIYDMYMETYGPGDVKPNITGEEEEQKPAKPDGYDADLTQDMFPNGAYNLEKKIGNGDVIYGQKNKDAFVDLSAYSSLTVVGTPGLKIVFNLNHNVDVKENLSDYENDDANDYVWVDATLDSDGMYTLDLTQWDAQNLNNIRLPWDNNNKGYVWYLLLKNSGSAPVIVVPDRPDGYDSDLTQDMYQSWTDYNAGAESEGTLDCELNLETSIGNGAMVYGQSSAHYLQYADLSNYSEIAVVADKGMIIRLMFNRTEPELDDAGGIKDPNGGAYIEKALTVGDDNIVTVDLTADEFASYAHLNAIKIPWSGSATGKVYYILLKEKTATGIKAIESTESTNDIFDLQGRRVSNAAKGVYIVNGKKVVF